MALNVLLTLHLMAGRPSKYKPEYCRIAYQMALLGSTDEELARAFDVDERTINNWKDSKPEFFQSLKKGKEFADAEIADRLFQRAKGYEHEDLFITQYQGQIIKQTIVKYYPPDTTAAIFWLKNRQPNLWRDRQYHDLTSGGEKIQPIEFTVASKETIDVTKKLIDEAMLN